MLLHLDELWDSPHNRADPGETRDRRHLQMSRRPRQGYRTSNQLRHDCRPGHDLDGENSVGEGDVSDGLQNTLLVVEMSDSGIHWAEPRDVKADEMSYRTNDPDRPCIRSRHAGGANVALCDGSVKYLWDSIPPQLIKALTTIAGGEDVREFWRSIDRGKAPLECGDSSPL